MMQATDLTAVVRQYFAGERAEMLLLLGFGVVLAIAGIALLKRADRFGRALGVTLVFASVLAAATAVPLLLRDPPHRDQLVSILATDAREEAVAAEVERMESVLRRYPMYRYAYVGVLVAAVVVAVVSTSRRWYGIAVGMALIAATGLIVDHFFERRAAAYHRALTHALEQGIQ